VCSSAEDNESVLFAVVPQECTGFLFFRGHPSETEFFSIIVRRLYVYRDLL